MSISNNLSISCYTSIRMKMIPVEVLEIHEHKLYSKHTWDFFYALGAVQLRSPFFFWDMVPQHYMITAQSFETVLILERVKCQVLKMRKLCRLKISDTNHTVTQWHILKECRLLIRFLKTTQHEAENLSEQLPDAYNYSCCTYIQRNFLLSPEACLKHHHHLWHYVGSM